MNKDTLSTKAIDKLRRALLERQRVLFQDVDLVDEDLRAIEESREAELEERGQQETMARLLEHVGDRDRHELEDIHRALVKIASGRYGTCEACSGPIDDARLDALPQTRWCVDCAAERERAREAQPRPFGPGAHRPLPPEYRELDDDDLADAVRDRIRAHGDPDLLEVAIRCHGGVVRLSGTIAGEPQRQVLRQIVADGMGLDLIDRLLVAGIDRELPGESERASEEVMNTEERIPAGRGMKPLATERPVVPEDEGEAPETPADGPIPEEE
jgi:RNA polymerase-binding transcription factor